MSLRVAYSLLPIICVAIIAVGSAHGEEPIPTPSEKMKDAVGKFNKAPASIGQSLQGLRDAAAAKPQKSGAMPTCGPRRARAERLPDEKMRYQVMGRLDDGGDSRMRVLRVDPDSVFVT